MNTPIATEWEGVADIPLWEITEDARNFYETEGSEDIERKNAELMDSIRSDGLMHPIVLRKNPGYRYNERTQDLTPRYVIVSGHRRFIAYQRLLKDAKNNDPENYQRWEKIPATYVETRDDLQARLMLLEANTTARDVTDWEKAKAVKEYGKILDEMKAQGEELEGRRRDHIAAALGMSKTNVGRFENINKNLSGEYQEELKAGTIGVSVADKIASLPEEQQKELHEEKGADVKLADVEAMKETPAIEADDGEEGGFKYIGNDYMERLGKKMGDGEELSPCQQCKLGTGCVNCCERCEKTDCGIRQQCRWHREDDVPDSGTKKNEESSDEETEYRSIRLEGLRRAYLYLRKAARKFHQRADVEQVEGNEQEMKALNMAGSVFGEMESRFFFRAVEEAGTDWDVFLKWVNESAEGGQNTRGVS